MTTTHRIILFVCAFLVSLVSACAGDGPESTSESAQESVCKKLRVEIADIEDKASIIGISSEAQPMNFELLDLGPAIREADLPTPYRSERYHIYLDVLNFLSNAEACLSEDALLYLNNWLDTPLIQSLREEDGN